MRSLTAPARVPSRVGIGSVREQPHRLLARKAPVTWDALRRPAGRPVRGHPREANFTTRSKLRVCLRNYGRPRVGQAFRLRQGFADRRSFSGGWSGLPRGALMQAYRAARREFRNRALT
jgi:hypothetical protein